LIYRNADVFFDAAAATRLKPNRPASRFPATSGDLAICAALGRLTGGLTDVGTDTALHWNLIRS
jgi:hypothetical protein